MSREDWCRGAECTKDHHVYVVLLESGVSRLHAVQEVNPRGRPGMAALYVGTTHLTPAIRFRQHKLGRHGSRWVRKWGISLVPELYQGMNPMYLDVADEAERRLTRHLRRRGFYVMGGT